MDKKKNSTANDQKQFSEHLDRATEIVRSWPSWKQKVLGIPNSNDPGGKKNAESAEDDKLR